MESNKFKRYSDWHFSATAAEQQLKQSAYEYEEIYFTDMSLHKFEDELTAHIDEHGVTYTSDIAVTIDEWQIIVTPDIDSEGSCDGKEHVIVINANCEDESGTLLHEMIHAYEFMLDEDMKQFLVIELFERLSNKIPGLKKLLIRDLHIYLQQHTPLFLLKSLDIDLRLGKPLGSIYGYGRLELFK